MGGAGEEARVTALHTTSTRLAATNRLLRDVAAIQRHAEDLCPGDSHINDAASEFSLDEPESSYAVRAEPAAGSPRVPATGPRAAAYAPESVRPELQAAPMGNLAESSTAAGHHSTQSAQRHQSHVAAVGPPESPLPAMMSELQQALSASVSSNGMLPRT